MEEKNLLQIKFSSFIKLFSSILLSIGIFAGILAFVISLFGGEAKAHLGTIELTGIPAGLLSLTLFPVFFYIIGVIWAIFAYLPFKIFLKLIEGLELKIDLE